MCISSLMCSANSCSLVLARSATWSVFLNIFCKLPHALPLPLPYVHFALWHFSIPQACCRCRIVCYIVSITFCTDLPILTCHIWRVSQLFRCSDIPWSLRREWPSWSFHFSIEVTGFEIGASPCSRTRARMPSSTHGPIAVNSMVYVWTLECLWKEIRVHLMSNFNVRAYSGSETSVEKE